MKKITYYITIILIISFNINILTAQDSVSAYKKFYIGFCSGINANGVLSVGTQFAIAKDMCIELGLGQSVAGTKYTMGLIRYTKNQKQWLADLSVSYSEGKENMSFIASRENMDSLESIELSIKPMFTINYSVGYCWNIKGRQKLSLSAGYSFAIKNDPYEIPTPGFIVNESSNAMINTFLQPGGGVLKLSYYF